MNRTAAFDAALEALYRTFVAPVPAKIEGCPCCLDRKEVKALHSKPLREQSDRDLANYAASVFLTVGDVADFRYFLPRIFEISATVPSWWPSPEVAVGKLKLAAWRSWPKAEQAVAEAFLLAWLDGLMAEIQPSAGAWDPAVRDLDEMICGLGRADFDLALVEERLLSDPVALKALRDVNIGRVWGGGRMTNEFWEDAPEARDRMVAFLKSEGVQEALAKGL